MARVTVEDCVQRVPNRFDLVMVAAQRARDITAGAQLTVDRDRDKNPVVALREVADATVSLDQLNESLIRGLQKHAEVDEPEETSELMELEQEVAAALAAQPPEAAEPEVTAEADFSGEVADVEP